MDSSIYFAGRSQKYDCADQSDIFRVRVLDDKFKKFGEPVRVDGGINSEFYDSYYTPTENGTVYFVSGRSENGDANIFVIQDGDVVTVEPVVPSVIEYAGFIREKNTGVRVDADSVIAITLNGVAVDSVVYNDENGYVLTLPVGFGYQIGTKVNGYESLDTLIDLVGEAKSELRQLDLYVNLNKKVDKDHFEDLSGDDFEVGQVFSMQHVYFVLSKVELMPESEPELNVLANILMDNPNVRIQIEGHTDYGGVESQNLVLSENRAKSVGEYLIEHGVNKKRIEYKGFGSAKRLVKSQVIEERLKNRRVEFRIIEIVVPK